jgi:hypothetical protein
MLEKESIIKSKILPHFIKGNFVFDTHINNTYHTKKVGVFLLGL